MIGRIDFQIRDMVEDCIRVIEKQQKETEELKANKGYHLGFIDGGIAKRYEYEDKIKAKIEVLEKLQKEFPNNDEIRIKIIAYKELLEKE